MRKKQILDRDKKKIIGKRIKKIGVSGLDLNEAEFSKNTVWVDEASDGNWGVYQKSINLIGAFQAENLLMAALIVIASGQEESSIFEVLGHEVFELLEQQENLRIAWDLRIQNVTKWCRDAQECYRKQYQNSESDADTRMNCQQPILAD